MIKYVAIISLFSLLLVACEGKSSSNISNDEHPNPNSLSIKILPLGDSITQGGEGYASYRRSLWFLLQDAGFNVDFIGHQIKHHGDLSDNLKDFDLNHEGHWAWETGELDEKLDGWLKGYTPDIVLLHVGTNDFDRGQSNESTMQEIKSIIAKLRKNNAKVAIFIAKIIPMKNKDTSSINNSIALLVDAQNTQKSPLVIVDQYTDYEPLVDNHDNYHPNSKGEDKIANKWFEVLEDYLQ